MKWFHLIGVCGKTTANIAKVFQDNGWFVTGSDSQFLPPASNLLKQYNINTVEGYNFKHLTKDFWEARDSSRLETKDISEFPDLVLFISHLTTKNKEYLFAKKKNLNIKPYAQILGEYLIKPESIVVVGTAGKTTTTALITKILQDLNLDPSYMIGAEVKDIADSLKITDSSFSVIEGDEYHNPDPEIEGKAKFLEYKPKYLVITSIGWEHQDIFPTEERYIEEFAKAVELVPEDGVIIAHYGDEKIDKVLTDAKCKVIRYAISDEQRFHRLEHKAQSAELDARLNLWTVKKKGNINGIYNNKDNLVLEFRTNLLGEYNLENILAAVITTLNLPSNVLPANLIREGTNSLKVIANSLNNFKGPKKRLEKLFENEILTVIDDFGVAPSRAVNSLKTLRDYYPEHKIIAVFEPNSGSRPIEESRFRNMYESAFNNADKIIIPDLSTSNPDLVTTEEMVKRLKELGYDSIHISSDNLVEKLSEEVKAQNSKILIVFFSSYRLTEIAENFVKKA